MGGMLAQTGADQSWFEDWGLPVLVTLATALIITIAIKIAVARFRRKLEGTPNLTQELNLQRIATLTGALSATALAIVWTIAVLIVLESLDVPLGPFFASAGIAGVALGFGAQSIVKDTLTGFFILLENQFGVGNTVEFLTTAGPVNGRVEWFTLRATAVRAYDGTLHIVPNGNIQVVSNKSRGWARAIVDTRIAYGQDPEEVRAILDELFDGRCWGARCRDHERHGGRDSRGGRHASVQEGRRGTPDARSHHPAAERTGDPSPGARPPAPDRARSLGLRTFAGPSGR